MTDELNKMVPYCSRSTLIVSNILSRNPVFLQFRRRSTTMSQTDLHQDLKDAPPIILSVLEAFKITQRFVAGIDYYYHPNDAQVAGVDYSLPDDYPSAEGTMGELTRDWVAFLDVSC